MAQQLQDLQPAIVSQQMCPFHMGDSMFLQSPMCISKLLDWQGWIDFDFFSVLKILCIKQKYIPELKQKIKITDAITTIDDATVNQVP